MNQRITGDRFLGDPAAPDSTHLGDEVEITSIPSLNGGEEALIDAHSLLNGFNALVGELYLLGFALADDENLLGRALGACERMLDAIRTQADGVAEARRMASYEETILRDVEEALVAAPTRREQPDVVRSVTTIRHVVEVLKVRAADYLARAQTPDLWVHLAAGDVRDGLVAFFRVVEANAKGRYRIVLHPAEQGPGDYYVDLRFGSPGESLWIPDVLRDVLRDLAANARKFTAPGGIISVGLANRAGKVSLVVTDTGRGIPPDEIERVVHFGAHGSNVFDVRTYGGGFGLTKAFLTAKRFRGRFWIASQLGVGTRVRLEIPEPACPA